MQFELCVRPYVCVDVDAFVSAQQTAIAQLLAMIPVLRSDLANFIKFDQSNNATVKAAQETCRAKLIALQVECDALRALTVEQTLAQKDRFEQLDDKTKAAWAQLKQEMQRSAFGLQPHPLLQWISQIHAYTFLRSLAAPQRAYLTGLLGGGIPLVSSVNSKLGTFAKLDLPRGTHTHFPFSVAAAAGWS